MITMVVFVLVIVAASQIFTGLLTQFKQQSTIAESNIEGVVGLDILRRDLAHAGFGLPWVMNGAIYNEAVTDTIGETPWVDRNLSDGPPGSSINRGCTCASTSTVCPSCSGTTCSSCTENNAGYNAPAAFRSLNNMGISASTGTSYIPNTTADVLAIKSTNVAMNDASQKWSFIANRGAWSTILRWGTMDQPNNGDFITVIDPSPSAATNSQRQLSTTAGFYTTFGDTIANGPALNSNNTFVIYDLGTNAPRMPFNRADYYVKRPASGMPSRCAPNTGILYKATINNTVGLATSGYHTEMPLLDCVADFQVDYMLDTDGDGTVDTPFVDDISNLPAAQVRAEVKEVRVYIVSQEGRKDLNYDFSNGGTRTALSTTEVYGTQSNGRTFVDLKNMIGNPAYKYYRWKLYTLIVKPMNLQ